MTFVVSDSSLRALSRPATTPTLSLHVTDEWTEDYEAIWRTQGAVRTVIDFLARNIASLAPKVYERVSDTDRTRITDHPLADLLSSPNPRTTRYRLLSALVSDMCIYDTAYWLKARGQGGRLSLYRIPPRMVTPKGETWLAPEYYRIQGSRGYRDVSPDDLVAFRGYAPAGDLAGAPPMESLRQALAEAYEAGNMRSQVLRNGARASGYLRRPATSRAWSDEAREKFARSWATQYVGANAPGAGGTPILEDGMEFVPAAQTSEELQYVEVRKLTREEVASAFHVPAPMVGILDHATFSNIREQHKQLYQDTLGPWLDMIEQELDLQLVPELAGGRRLYVEFDIAAKLRGDLAEESQSLYQAAGGPYMTRNEVRARRNLPAIEGGDDLITPLSVTTSGGDAAPTGAAGDTGDATGATDTGKAAPTTGRKARARTAAPTAAQVAEARTATGDVLAKFFKRQRASVLSAIGSKAAGDWWDGDRWDSELADDLEALAVRVTSQLGVSAARQLGFTAGDYDVDRTRKFLRAVAESRAGAINSTTRDQVAAALAARGDDGEDGDGGAPSPADVFDQATSSRGEQSAVTLATTLAGFAVTEAASQVAPGGAMKQWTITSGNPRASHVAVGGETVPVDQLFSNGMNWPGDPEGGVDEVAGCTCTVTTIIP